MKLTVDEIFGWLSACFSIITNFIVIKDSLLLYRAKAKYALIPSYMRIENIIKYFVCSGWFIYALFLKDTHLLICNSIGTLIFLFWIILIFILY